MTTKISELPDTQEIIWLSDVDVADTGLRRDAAGVVAVTNGSTGYAAARANEYRFGDDSIQVPVLGRRDEGGGAAAITLTINGNGVFKASAVGMVLNEKVLGFNDSFGAGPDVAFARVASTIVSLTNGSTGGGALQFTEMSAPSAGASDTARLFCRDNGSGKSQLCVIFATGAIQVIATEP